MIGLTREEGLALLFDLTLEEQDYRKRRAAEIFNDGGTLAEMIRRPLEEIALARRWELAREGGAE